MGIIEKAVGVGYEVASRIISRRTGRPTVVRVDLLEGPMINGEIRPDLINPAERYHAAFIAFQSGETSFSTSNMHARQLRRRIVF